jgi:(p)ppGpp synthase/HD superfamily hydrolase
MTLIEKAEFFARWAHRDQKRGDGETPYIIHPQAVVKMLQNDDYVKAVAWLHDVLEDTKITQQDLISLKFPADVIEAVKVLTKTKDVPYEEYLKHVKRNTIARCVKIADMLHNLCDKPTDSQKEKYKQGILFLCN